jgi:anti-sigma regulatory factor (Ser/Thr protein kinase)
MTPSKRYAKEIPDTVAEYVFPARMEVIPQVVDFVSEAAEAAGLDAERVMHVQLAVEEAVVNVAQYAYEGPPGEVLVRAQGTDQRFTVELVDTGAPFDPLAGEEPDLQADLEERPIGGLGIFLIRQVMDEVHYRREEGRNILTLVLDTDR